MAAARDAVKILQITGPSTDDERVAVCQVLRVWENGGACSGALMNRLPKGRVEILIAPPDSDEAFAIIVMENGIVAFHPLDDSDPETVH